jgi:hypothetical protein
MHPLIKQLEKAKKDNEKKKELDAIKDIFYSMVHLNNGHENDNNKITTNIDKFIQEKKDKIELLITLDGFLSDKQQIDNPSVYKNCDFDIGYGQIEIVIIEDTNYNDIKNPTLVETYDNDKVIEYVKLSIILYQTWQIELDDYQIKYCPQTSLGNEYQINYTCNQIINNMFNITYPNDYNNISSTIEGIIYSIDDDIISIHNSIHKPNDILNCVIKSFNHSSVVHKHLESFDKEKEINIKNISTIKT